MLIEGWMRLGVVALAMIAGILFVLRPRRPKNRKSPGKSETAHTEYSNVDQFLGGNHHTHDASAGHGHGND